MSNVTYILEKWLAQDASCQLIGASANYDELKQHLYDNYDVNDTNYNGKEFIIYDAAGYEEFVYTIYEVKNI